MPESTRGIPIIVRVSTLEDDVAFLKTEIARLEILANGPIVEDLSTN